MEWPLGQCFSFNSDDLCRTSSHIWGRWYLPMFLFRDGSLTLMSRASLIALVRFWSSLPHYSEVVDVDLMTWDIAMIINWGRGLLVFFEPLFKGYCRLSNVLFLTPIFIAFISIYDSTFVGNRILALWSHKEAFDGLSSFEVNLYPTFLAWFLDPLTKPLMIWNHHV